MVQKWTRNFGEVNHDPSKYDHLDQFEIKQNTKK